jgi:transcriptional regulator
MYIPSHFNETRPEEIRRIVEANPLGALVTHGAGGLDAEHIPFEYEPAAGAAGVLRAHVARANPLWQRHRDGDPALVIFGAADAYVSPNWYPSKHESHRQVPTWNYQVVHVHGRLWIRDDEKFLRAVVGRLTRSHEARSGVARPWKMSDSESDYISQLMAAIVGIEVEIIRIEAKSKLSQNKDARDRAGVIGQLRQRGVVALAEAMDDAAPPPA